MFPSTGEPQIIQATPATTYPGLASTTYRGLASPRRVIGLLPPNCISSDHFKSISSFFTLSLSVPLDPFLASI